MALRECTTLHILTCNTYQVLLHSQRTKGQGLGRAHIDAFTIINGLLATLKDTRKIAMHHKIVRMRSRDSANVFETVLIHTSVVLLKNTFLQLPRRREAFPST